MQFELKWVHHNSDDYCRAVELRREILRLPLNLDFTPQELAAEDDQNHLVALLGDELVACLCLSTQGSIARMRQVAVATHWQGSGFGQEIVKESEHFARSLGCNEMILHARAHVIPFYERLGYRVDGQEFEEVCLPHRLMRKSL